MKTKLNMKTTLGVILFATGCALAQEPAGSNANLTVTDLCGRVLMTNATYTCMYQGRLFFARGCYFEGFAPGTINRDLLGRLGIDLQAVEAKGREDVRKQQEQERIYQRYVQDQIAWKAIEDERAARRAGAQAARRAEEEKAAREAARAEMIDLEPAGLAMGAAPAVQWSGPREIWQSSVAVPYPVFSPRWHHIYRSREHCPEASCAQKGSNTSFVPLKNGSATISRDVRVLPNRNQMAQQAPRINPKPQVNANSNRSVPVIHR